MLNSGNQCYVTHFVIYEQLIVISLFHTFFSIPALRTITTNKILASCSSEDRCIVTVFVHMRMVLVWKAADKMLIPGLIKGEQKQHLSACSQFGCGCIEINTKCGEKLSIFFLCFMLFPRSAFPSLAPPVLSIFLSLSVLMGGRE